MYLFKNLPTKAQAKKRLIISLQEDPRHRSKILFEEKARKKRRGRSLFSLISIATKHQSELTANLLNPRVIPTVGLTQNL